MEKIKDNFCKITAASTYKKPILFQGEYGIS